MLAQTLRFCFVCLVLSLSLSTLAHTRWAPDGVLTPRSTNTNIKNGPCGVARGNTLTVFEPGQTIEVAFQSNIFHEGYFRIAFSPENDEGFDDYVLASDIPDVEGQENRTVTITLPEMECESCTLQLIQTMLDRSPPSDYFSCANIALRQPEVPPEPPIFIVGVSSEEGNNEVVYTDTGLVSVEVQLDASEIGRNFEYDWSVSDDRLVDTHDAPHIFQFDTTVLAADDYVVSIKITDKAFSDVSSEKDFTVTVLPEEPIVTAGTLHAWTIYCFMMLALSSLRLRLAPKKAV